MIISKTKFLFTEEEINEFLNIYERKYKVIATQINPVYGERLIVIVTVWYNNTFTYKEINKSFTG